MAMGRGKTEGDTALQFGSISVSGLKRPRLTEETEHMDNSTCSYVGPEYLEHGDTIASWELK